MPSTRRPHSSIDAARSRRRRTASVPGLTVSPHSFSLGNLARSKRRTRAPARARTAAATEPAGPAPTIKTSSITARGAPPPLALARRRGFAALPSGTSLGPQAHHCSRGPTPARSRSAARLRRASLRRATPTRVPRWGPRASLGPQAHHCWRGPYLLQSTKCNHEATKTRKKKVILRDFVVAFDERGFPLLAG